MLTKRRIELEGTVFFYPGEEPGTWVAHYLDYDIVGVGKNPAKAFTTLMELMIVYVAETLKISQHLTPEPAPKHFWDMAAKATPLPLPDVVEWLRKFSRKTRLPQKAMPVPCHAALSQEPVCA